MKKIILFAFLLVGISACSCYKEIPVSFPDGAVVRVRVADTYKKQERAWLGQKPPYQTGVLFVFLRDEEQTYWRKNTQLDLDVIFVDSNHRITALRSQIPHRDKYTINAEIPFAFATANYLLEFPAGTIENHGLSVGDTISFVLP